MVGEQAIGLEPLGLVAHRFRDVEADEDAPDRPGRIAQQEADVVPLFGQPKRGEAVHRRQNVRHGCHSIAVPGIVSSMSEVRMASGLK